MVLYMTFMLLSARCLNRSFHGSHMGSRPLALGAGAGTLGSVLTTLAQQALRTEIPAPVCDLALELEPNRIPLIFWTGLLLGLLLGILLGGILDLLYLWKQHCSISLRNRLASLQIKGGVYE